MTTDKKILGIDLGSSSIGWFMVLQNKKKTYTSIGGGVRVIPLNTDEKDGFSKGNTFTNNQKRTQYRSIRRNTNRKKQRRDKLSKLLTKLGMYPEKDLLLKVSKNKLWGLRAKAVTEKLCLQEIGRILLLINNKRGYASNKKVDSEEANGQKSEYLGDIQDRYSNIKNLNLTVGQFFNEELKKDPNFRVKENVFPRIAYKEEFEKIWDFQKVFYPEVLTDENFTTIASETIFYQRPLKSQKHLISICEFEGREYLVEGKNKRVGAKVAQKSNPMFQIEKIWESIHNIRIYDKHGKLVNISLEQKELLFNILNKQEKLTKTQLLSTLGLNSKEKYKTDKNIQSKGVQGNITYAIFDEILGQNPKKDEILKLELSTKEIIDKKTGEVRNEICPEVEKEPLYRLWHYVHSLDENDAFKKIKAEFSVTDEEAKELSALDFSNFQYGKKSVKSIRKLLPYLMQGHDYTNACLKAGYKHSESPTKQEIQEKKLLDVLELLPKGSLRQPIVEKILNQLILLINEIIQHPNYGRPDEVRIELSRELKQSTKERNSSFRNNNAREKERQKITKRLKEEGVKVSERNILKYKLWEEFDKQSPYEIGKAIGLADLFREGAYEIEHIIPRSIFFDDSFANKTICPAHLNSGEKGKNRDTAYDFMTKRNELDTYLNFIHKYEKKISATKMKRLLCKGDEIPQDFLNRQLKETQYISKEATKILNSICRKVTVTTGGVTAFLRSRWGYNEIIRDINLPKYQQAKQTETITYVHQGQSHSIEKIQNWSKRDDHRHHALDALVVATTSQSIIQRLNTLSAQKTREEMIKWVANTDPTNKSRDKILMEQYVATLKPFHYTVVKKALENILISRKAGKKVANWSVAKYKGQTVQGKILTPRGALSEESVYGKIEKQSINKQATKLSPSFTLEMANMIANKDHKTKVLQRLNEFGNDSKKAFKQYKKNPIFLDEEQLEPLMEVNLYTKKDVSVIRKSLSELKEVRLNDIVDKKIKELVLSSIPEGKTWKDRIKTLETDPIYQNKGQGITIKRVRIYVKSQELKSISVDDKGNQITYEKFVVSGNNHHSALYRDNKGKVKEHIVTFWHAVERKKYKLPVIVKNTEQLWSKVLEENLNEQSFLAQLPDSKWEFISAYQQGEYFVFNMEKSELEYCINSKDYQSIAPNLFWLRSIYKGNYSFSHQYETEKKDSEKDKEARRFIRMRSIKGLEQGIKVRVNRLGEISIT